MAKKSVTPSLRMDEDQYLKLKALKKNTAFLGMS